MAKGEAWPVLHGVAEWIGARGVWTSRGFEIHDIEGPDESIGNVNNSNYVNVAAMMVLERAIAMNAQLPTQLADPQASDRWKVSVVKWKPNWCSD